MTERKTYTVITSPWEKGLCLDVKGLDVKGVTVTQTHEDYPEDTPEAMARDLVSLLLEIPPDSFDLVFEAAK